MLRILITLSLVSLSGLFLTSNAQTDEFNLDEVYAIDAGGTIRLDSDDAEVLITGSDREDVRVIVHYKLKVKGISFGNENKFKMIVEERNGDLRIYEKQRNFGTSVVIGSARESYTIEIQAPYDVNLNLDGDDGEYEISEIDGSIKLEADDTDARITNCGGDDFLFTMDDGRLYMEGGTGRLDIEADDGDITITDGSFSQIDVGSDDSDIEIATSLSDDGRYRFDLDDASLSLTITGGGGEFDIRHDDADIDVSREFEEIRDREGSATYRLKGGNAKVRIRSDDGDIWLRVD